MAKPSKGKSKKLNKKQLRYNRQLSNVIKNLENKNSLDDLRKEKNDIFLASFKHFDSNQSESFEDWEKSGLLSRFFNVIHSYSKSSLKEQLDNNKTTNKFIKYGNFPENSNVTHPKFIPEDADWARIHIDGKTVIAGHIVDNIFYIVFLDSQHKFWITERK